jgi:ABC-type uncharacterized transport system YnjBCD ATPase subunit
MSKTMIRVTSLDKRFGDNHVLKNINFEVEQGDVVAIIGSSGSGKSTLLRCLIDLEQADGGTIMIEDKALVKDGVQAPPAEIKSIISRMGVVFQHFNLFPHLSVRKNLQLAPRIVAKADKGTIEANTKKLLDEVGLSDRIDAMPSTLSGGEKAARRHCPGADDEPGHHAFRRTHLGPGPGTHRRSAEGHGRFGEGEDDDDRRHPRNGICALGREQNPVYERRDHFGRRHAG